MRKNLRQAGFTILETVVVVALIGVIGAIAVPQLGNALKFFKISGDARSISNAVALTKMRAASNFSKTRLYVSTAGGWHRLERADRSVPPQWTVDGGVTYLTSGTSFGVGPVGTPPAFTQAAISQAAPCKNNAGADIAGTACIIFNSRGIPVDGVNFNSTADHAAYVTDGTVVYGVTIAATGMVRLWQTKAAAAPTWVLQ